MLSYSNIFFLLLVIGLCPLTNSLDAQVLEAVEQEQKMTSLSVSVLDVFDSTEAISSHPIARALNSLHISTVPVVISRELLFLEDSLITEIRLKESESNLRRLGIFSKVNMDIVPLTDGRHVNVTVKDQFTTAIHSSLRRESGKYKGRIGLSESNFLGRGYRLSTFLSNKDSRVATSFRFANPRVFHSRFRTDLNYTRYSEGDFYNASIHRPFFSNETQWDAFAGYTEYNGEQHKYFSEDDYIVYPSNYREFSFSVGKYFGKKDKARVALGYYSLDDNYYNTPDNTWYTTFDQKDISNIVFKHGMNYDALQLDLGLITRTPGKINFIDDAGPDEELQEGFALNIVLRKMDGTISGTEFTPHYRKLTKLIGINSYSVKKFTPHELLTLEIGLEGTGQEGDQSRFKFDSRMFLVSQRVPNQTLVARAHYSYLSSERPFDQLYLGEFEGLRGYATRSMSGMHRFLMNIESRIRTNLKILFVDLGGVLFFDGGSVWTWDKMKMHSSAGFGLRFSSSKAPKAIIRIDMAYNFDKSEFSSFSISKGHFFRVLFPIEIGRGNFKRSIVY